ncbi:hypothetical protein [Edaphobacter albus]|uniref:hypothetical protein n=1 Tax=Edaphobacter sp. 4G125 TaxID=2763071 RepID=UPI001646BC84|nr:hypothetical protein [Edaphobacter sp. 4G125]QNI37884.1 hypothetical protein H7846_06335 [Edaphobacter sp. 4G125]
MLDDRRPLLFLPLAALIAIAPLLVHGCSCGHDFDFHIINWFEAAHQFAHGNFFPHWAATPAWNAGEPRFVFYPPLSWWIGSLLGLILPWTWTPIAYTWLALTGAGLTLYYTARSFVSPNAALIAATIYLTNPYTLYTAFERSAYAELLAAAWMPLALYAVLKKRVTIPGVAIPVALLWLTNAPAAVMGSYAMALLIFIRILMAVTPVGKSTISENCNESSSPPGSLALNSALGALLGLGLASFYLIPAAWERRFVQINFAILPGLRPWDNFLFQHTADPEHDKVLFTASIVAVVLIALTALAFLWSYRVSTKSPNSSSLRRLRFTFLLLALVISFMLTPWSIPLWRYLPELRFLQFPWRLLAVLACIFGFTVATALPRIPRRASLCVILSAILLALPSYHFFHQYCYPEDTIPERLAIFRSSNPGTDPTDEYTPTTADNDSLNQGNPGYWLAPSPSASAPDSATPAPAPHSLELSPTTPAALILNLRNYPAWRITRNGTVITTLLHRKDGLIAIPLPAGPSRIEITYATLPDQWLGNLFSGLSLAALILLFRRRQHTAASQNSPVI